MKIHHLRNATLILSLGEHRLLIDPMFARPGAIPGLRFFRGERRANPLVPLPSGAMAAMESATGVLVTHEHPDHLDVPAIEWIKSKGLPVWSSSVDAPNLGRKGLDAREVESGGLGMTVEVIPAAHGTGLIGWLMGPVSGFYLAHPDEPSVYITGDSVLTETVLEAVARLEPDVIIAPAGAANFGVGPDILFSVDELVALVKAAPGDVVLNHLEALDHCLTTREGLRATMASEGLGGRVHVPEDGASLSFEREARGAVGVPVGVFRREPGFQKWLTAKFAGT